MKYRALVAREGDSKRFVQSIEELDTSNLPDGDLLVRVLYSSLNFKDALSATGRPGVTRSYPHTPGIDAAGVVVESGARSFKEGDQVLVTGFDLGMNTPGGFGEYIRIPSKWALGLPAGLDPAASMKFGTAGFTAALAVDRLVHAGVSPASGTVVVTGAKGGVGSFSVAILSKIGYAVAAVSGSTSSEDYLRKIGADEFMLRSSLEDKSVRPLLHGRWAGGVDTVGGPILSNLIKSIAYGGAVASCGNAASGSFDGSVYPFILRGISLLGVESANYPVDGRVALWGRLGGEWNVLDRGISVEVCSLTALPERIARMIQGKVTGRIVVDLSI